jgi:hypothetical protein
MEASSLAFDACNWDESRLEGLLMAIELHPICIPRCVPVSSRIYTKYQPIENEQSFVDGTRQRRLPLRSISMRSDAPRHEVHRKDGIEKLPNYTAKIASLAMIILISANIKAEEAKSNVHEKCREGNRNRGNSRSIKSRTERIVFIHSETH